MKKIFYLIALVFFVSSCQDLTEYNVNEKNPALVPASGLITNATVELFDQMVTPNVNLNNFRLWAQQWTQTTYTDESNYELVERNVNGRTYSALYATVLKDLSEAKKIINADELINADYKANQLAIITVLETYTYHVLVDIFGDVPFSEAISGTLLPVYDNDADIYTAIIANLDGAINTLKLGGASGLGSADIVYGGDTDMWNKFANSLKLRLAIRIADSNDAKAATMAKQAQETGVFTAGEGFNLNYQSAPPYTNPVWDALVQSGRTDFVAANTMADYMNSLEDPRRSVYYQDLDSSGNVVGAEYGQASEYTLFSHPGTKQESATFRGSIMNGSEVSFLLADAAERGYDVTGSAAEHYTNGIAASFIEWDATGLADYLARADVDYATAPGNWKEKIAMQKWIALYDNGFEAWSTYRVYDAPTMNVAADAQTLPPTRFTYPVTEYSLNGENVKAASAAIGGDDSFTKVFWDVN